MRKFITIPRKPRTLAEMRQYLTDHYRYAGQDGDIAHRVKIHDLKTTSAEDDAMNKALSGDDSNLYYHAGVIYELSRFSDLHPGFTILSAGRSNGYFVLQHKHGNLYGGPEWANDLESSDDVRWLFALVWDFDQTCNKAVASFVDYCVYESPNWELAPND